MKKVLIGLVALSAVAMAKNEVGKMNVYGRFGYDLMSSYDDLKVEGGGSYAGDTKGAGYELDLEFTYNLIDNYELGLGLGYQVHTPHAEVKYSLDTSSNPMKTAFSSYNSMPIYLVNRYTFDLGSAWKPFAKLDIGYSINSLVKNASTDGYKYTDYEGESFTPGIYYGIGAGVEYMNLTFDAMYKVNTGSWQIKGTSTTDTYSQNYSRIALSLGYKFTI